MRADTNQEINYIRQGYQISSAVYSIVSDIAAKAASIPIKVYEVKDDTALKSLKYLQKQPRTPQSVYKQMQLHRKALQAVPEDNPIQRIIDQPNPDDDATTFWQMFTGFRLLCGNSYLYTPRLDMGADKGKVVELRIMPSQFVILYVNNLFPQKVIGYQLIIDGVTLLETKEVIQIRYPNYDWSVDGQQLYGMSPLRAAAKTLLRSNQSEDTGIALLANGGPSVIIANKSIESSDFGVEQIGASKQQFQREYAGPQNRGKYKMMAGDISAIPLGIDAVDLDLLAGEGWTFDMLCNVYKVSSTMFNNHSASTESNVKEMRKDSYTRAVLPERQAVCDAINRHIVPAYNVKGKKYHCEMDISGIPELQPDMATMAAWLNAAWWVTPNEKREMQDFEESTDPNMSKIWLPTGLQLMDDLVLPEAEAPDLDDTTTQEVNGDD